MKSLSLLIGTVLLQTMVHAAPLPLLIAHRGASHAAPENTLAAFKLALEEGADGIEGDFYLSSDGEVVCIHDADTERVAGTKLVVTKTAWKDLAALDVGSWKSPAFKNERIPRLGDVLDVLKPDKRFFLEIKDGPRIVGPIRRILEEKHADPKQVVLISFNPKVIEACRTELPAYQAHWISNLKDFASKRESYETTLTLCGAQGFQFDAKAPVDPAWLGQLRDKGFSLTAWTVDDPELARKMIGCGVNQITTNRPASLRGELAE